MSDPASQAPWCLLLLLLAGACLLCELAYLGRRWKRADAVEAPRFPFWLGMLMWVVLGLLERSGACSPLWRAEPWILPVVGLMAMALVRWLTTELPQFRSPDSPEAGEPPANPVTESSTRRDLDADDARLLRSLLAMIGKRAADLMIPVSEVACVEERDHLGRVLEVLSAGETTRVPVLDDERTRAAGIIDGRELLSLLYSDVSRPEALQEGAIASEIAIPLPEVPAREGAKRAMDLLRSRGGVAAVVDARGRVLGFLAWEPLFRVLLEQRSNGGLT